MMESSSLYSDVLKEFYYAPLVAQLNSMIEYRYGPPLPASWYEERGLPLPWVYVPPPWYKRIPRNMRWKIRNARTTVGFWIAGHTPEDW